MLGIQHPFCVPEVRWEDFFSWPPTIAIHKLMAMCVLVAYILFRTLWDNSRELLSNTLTPPLSCLYSFHRFSASFYWKFSIFPRSTFLWHSARTDTHTSPYLSTFYYLVYGVTYLFISLMRRSIHWLLSVSIFIYSSRKFLLIILEINSLIVLCIWSVLV